MKPKDILGIIIRAWGLYLLRPGLMYFYDYWYWSIDTTAQPSSGVRPYSGNIYLVFGIVYLIIAAYFLRGAPRLLSYCYPEPPSEPKDTDDKAA